MPREDFDVSGFLRRPVALVLVAIVAAAAGFGFGTVVPAIAITVSGAIAWWTFRLGSKSSGGRRIAWAVVAALAASGALIQFVPYGYDHTNPPVTAEPAWNTPETRALAVRACFDCHSNETVWPWYTDLAPVSWVVTNHVDVGRQVLDFSTWDRGHGELGEITETIRQGGMPPLYYRLIHSSARLTSAEKQQLIDGLQATFSAG